MKNFLLPAIILVYSVTSLSPVVAQNNNDNINIIRNIFANSSIDGGGSSIDLSGLKGNIKSIKITTTGDGRFEFPFDNIRFSIEGYFSEEIDYNEWGGESVPFFELEEDEQHCYKLEGELFTAKFDIINDPHKREIIIWDHDGGESVYDFYYNEENKLSKIIYHTSWWYDYETKDRREETNIYDVLITSEDVYGNWTDITLLNANGTQNHVSREFTYYGKPKLIYNKNEVYCISFADEEFIYSLQRYDSANKVWNNIMPEYKDGPMYIKDYRIVNDDLYVTYKGSDIMPTELYRYDLLNGTMNYITQDKINDND